MNPNDSDQANEGAWVTEQRKVVLAYLQRQGIQFGEVGEWPAWHLFPYLAIWVVESFVASGRVGWWAISGDVPTDYVSFKDADHPREAMRHFARQWVEASSFMLRGEAHPDLHIGRPEQWPELGVLLRSRAEIIQRYADNEQIWSD